MLKSVVVSKQALASDDPYDLVYSNIQFVNLLMQQMVRGDEMVPASLQSYYVDYYLTQVNNGGFAQFVWNSHSITTDAPRVFAGLEAIGAKRHLALFKDSMAKIETLGPERFEKFLQSELFGENPERDELGGNDDAFYALAEEEDIIELNSTWLRSLPGLVVVDKSELEAEARRQAAPIPEDVREARRIEAHSDRPEYFKAVDALCEATGQTLDRITAGDPAHRYKSEATVAWHFLTDQGHFYYVMDGSEIVMFNGSSNAEVIRITAPWL